MVEPREIVELGNLSKVLRQLVQLLVLLPVQMGLHEGADLVRTHMHKHTDTTQLFLPHTLATVKRGRAEDGHEPSIHSVGS